MIINSDEDQSGVKLPEFFSKGTYHSVYIFHSTLLVINLFVINLFVINDERVIKLLVPQY